MVLQVVVTGASRGLGRAIAMAYVERGDVVWAGCRTVADAADLVDLGAHVLELDVADEPSVVRFAENVRAEAGWVDVLINAAGVDARSFGAPPEARGPFELSSEHFLSEVRVNAVGPMLLTRSLRDLLVAARQAKVVNLSSRTGSMAVGADLCWDIGYNASKAALNAVTVRTARLLQLDGVIVVAVHPGWVRTEMGGPDALTSPEAVAHDLTELVDRLGPEHAGGFLQLDGTKHPW